LGGGSDESIDAVTNDVEALNDDAELTTLASSARSIAATSSANSITHVAHPSDYENSIDPSINPSSNSNSNFEGQIRKKWPNTTPSLWHATTNRQIRSRHPSVKMLRLRRSKLTGRPWTTSG
jgi:hypothetical protein